MKKKNLYLLLTSLLSISSLEAAEDISTMFSEGKTSGEIRMFYVDREYQGSLGVDTHRNSLTLGGHLKYESDDYYGLSLASAFYTTNRINWFTYDEQDRSLLGAGLKNYSILGEAYVNYDLTDFGSKTAAKLGYQRYDTAMIGSDDARMVPNTFETYKFSNNDVENIKVQIAHVNSIAYGTFSNIYTHDGSSAGKSILAATSGYAARGNATTSSYQNMGEASIGKETDGVSNIEVSFKNKNFNAKLSNDYAWDLYNTLYIDAGANWNCLLNKDIKMSVAGQFIKQDSVGGNYMQYTPMQGDGAIDSIYLAAKVGVAYRGFKTYLAYSKTTSNAAGDSAYSNAILTQFGGMPAYTQGMVTRHQFLAGTDAYKLAASYSFKELEQNIVVSAYYTMFDMDANSGYGIERTASEPGFDIKYTPKMLKDLHVRFRGNFPRRFYESAAGELGWNEYRLITNYNF